MEDVASGEFDEISHETRAFLKELRPDEVALLRDAIRLVSAISTVGRIVKLAIIIGAGIVVGIGGVGEAIVKILHWLWPPLGPKP